MFAHSSVRLSRATVRQLHSSTRCLAEPTAALASSSTNDAIAVGKVVSSVTKLPRHDVEVGPSMQNRLDTYYVRSLARDVQYMTYDHMLDKTPRDEQQRRTMRVKREWDPSSPYSKNRPEAPNRGNKPLAPNAANYADNVVELDRIVVSAFSSEAIVNRHALISLLAMMRAITGKPVIESQADPQVYTNHFQHKLPKTGYVRIIRSKDNVAAWKLRKNAPCGVKAVLPQKSAYRFLEILITFVMPRLRDFSGITLPSANQPQTHGSAVQGTVSFGFGPQAMGLFPQTEINWDSFPNKPPGFNVDCITNQRGQGASEKARQLLSGLGVPFVRRGET